MSREMGASGGITDCSLCGADRRNMETRRRGYFVCKPRRNQRVLCEDWDGGFKRLTQ